jgi:hypothetical protein
MQIIKSVLNCFISWIFLLEPFRGSSPTRQGGTPGASSRNTARHVYTGQSITEAKKQQEITSAFMISRILVRIILVLVIRVVPVIMPPLVLALQFCTILCLP